MSGCHDNEWVDMSPKQNEQLERALAEGKDVVMLWPEVGDCEMQDNPTDYIISLGSFAAHGWKAGVRKIRRLFKMEEVMFTHGRECTRQGCQDEDGGQGNTPDRKKRKHDMPETKDAEGSRKKGEKKGGDKIKVPSQAAEEVVRETQDESDGEGKIKAPSQAAEEVVQERQDESDGEGNEDKGIERAALGLEKLGIAKDWEYDHDKKRVVMKDIPCWRT